MNLVLDTILSTGTAIGTALAASTIAAGDSFTIRNASTVNLLAPWLYARATGGTYGQFGVMAGSMHDPTYGLQGMHAATTPFPTVPERLYKVGSRDTLVCKIADTATAGTISNLIVPVLYEGPIGLPTGQYIWPSEMEGRATGRLAVAYKTLTAGTTVGYSGAAALSAFTNQIPGGKNYALLGAVSSVVMSAITIKGPCTGNFRIAIPASLLWKQITSRWMVYLSNTYNRPLVPVINSNDFPSTVVEVVNDEQAASPIITLYLAELAS
jgi:hypothetical protein